VTRILIADGHEVVRSDLRAILEGRAGWEIVAEAKNGKEAIAKAIETQPDVAIIDYSLRLMNGIEVTCQIHAGIPKAEILVFTLHHSEELVRQLLEAGARGHLLKSDAKQYLIPAVETLADHKPFFAGRILKGETPANLPIEFPRGSSWSSISRPLTSNSATVSELKETRTIPIVLANMPDPVALGFAQNLACPAAMSPDSRVLRRHLPPNGLSC
jgi:DNA-binding NarL/FixJ family response regulator